MYYQYGTISNANINAVGKIIFQEDASGWQKFRYGKLGEVIENIRTFALPYDDHPYTFKMQYQYDSYNRIQTITYPDGEVVGYDYGRGGMLKRVTGDKNGVHYTYIDSVKYNEFELKDTVWYGNGTQACYEYDSLQRLSRLQSMSADGPMQDISYMYDSVGNITLLHNNAPTTGNGLGGRYQCDFAYDNSYRMTFAKGSWIGVSHLEYCVNMSYYNNGRISEKSVRIDNLTTGTVQSQNTNVYHYSLNTNKLISVSTPYQELNWDATGNMIGHRKNPPQGFNNRYLCWDEQNRLLGVKDENNLSYYQYDANGDRTYKLTGMGYLQNISGAWNYHYTMANATLYASPFLVATDKGYTKHYYAENERIASRIGGGGLSDIENSLFDNDHVREKVRTNNDMMDNVLTGCLNTQFYSTILVLKDFYDWQDSLQPEHDCYWYHPDHLGSSSWITHTNGHTVQHLLYLPWGEDLINQKQSGFDGVRFTFSAKEKDPETGLSYFGSRYYSSDLSIWLSVDPMAAKYPSLSPYTYCADNPVRCVDPNGEDIWEINNETGKVTRTANTMKDEIRVVNNDGEIIKDDNGKLQSLTYKYGTIKHYTTKKNGYDVFRIRGDDNGTALFELMANNTNVEWTQYKTGIAGEQGLNFVTTGHSSEGNAASANLFNMQLRFGYYIREHIHNHPGTMPVPSGMPNTSQEGTGDIAVASQINKNNENLGYKIPTYKIYTKGYGYQEYNANSRVSDFENIYQFFNMRPALK